MKTETKQAPYKEYGELIRAWEISTINFPHYQREELLRWSQQDFFPDGV